MLFQLDGTPPNMPFPEPHLAEDEPNGLLAVGGDLRIERLLNAYRQGVFPWYSEGQPLLWWSPNPRMVLYPGKVHVSRSLRKQLKAGGLELRINSDFHKVTEECAAPRDDQDGTWLLPEMRDAYLALHLAGYAHSIELWHDNTLVGGMYGVSMGGVFFGESMFSRIPSASRIVMVYLSELLLAHGFSLIDCQVYNPHLERMGAIEIPRSRFLQELSLVINHEPAISPWRSPPRDCSQLFAAR